MPTHRILRRHVGDLPLERPALNAARMVGGFGDSKVRKLDLTGLAEQHVRRRHIAMNDAGSVPVLVGSMRKVERCGERVCHVRRQPRVEWLSLPTEMTQRPTKVDSFDELERQIVRAAGDPEVEHPRDVSVMKERRQTRFAKEHLHELRVADERRKDPLETNALFKPTRATPNRQEGLGHASDAEPLDQLVVAKTFGGRRGHERIKVTQRHGRRLASANCVAQSSEAKPHVARRSGGPHQADSPRLSLEIAEATADLDAVIGEELRAHCAVVDAFRDADEGEGREADRLVDGELEAEPVEASLERFGLISMTRVPGVEAFFEDEAEGFMQREDHVDRCRVMVDAFASEVLPDEIQIEVPALNRRLARAQHLARTFGKRNRREARWARETFLRARVDGVDAHAVDVDRHAAERGHGIDEKQCAARICDGAKRSEVLQHARRGFGVHDREHFEIPLLGRPRDIVRINRLPPGCIHHRHLGPATSRDLGHASTEDTVAANQRMVPGLQQVHEAGLHPRRSRSRHRKRQRVLGSEHLSQHPLRLVQYLEKHGIEMPNRWPGQRLQHRSRNIRRPRPHQHPLNRSHRATIQRQNPSKKTFRGVHHAKRGQTPFSKG